MKDMALPSLEKIGQNLWKHSQICVEELKGDASSRNYYRVKTGKESYVVSQYCSTDGESFSNFLLLQGILKKNGVRVPEIHEYDRDSGLMVQEDLGDMTFLKFVTKINSEEEELKRYKTIMDMLIKIHSIDPSLYKDEPFTKISFDEKRFLSEIDLTCQYFVHGLLKGNHSLIERIKSLFMEVCRPLTEQKKLITHRDFHSKNIMVKGESCVVMDFQDAIMGIPQYDLVSLLEDSYYRVSFSNKKSLKKYYWNNFLKSMNWQKDFDEFSYLYDLMLVQRSFKAIGSFSFFFKEKNNANYLRYIGLAFERIRETLLRYDDFRELRHNLNDLYYGT